MNKPCARFSLVFLCGAHLFLSPGTPSPRTPSPGPPSPGPPSPGPNSPGPPQTRLTLPSARPPSAGPPKISLFFPPHFRSFFSLGGVFSLYCGRGPRTWTTQNVRLGFSGVILCEPRRPFAALSSPFHIFWDLLSFSMMTVAMVNVPMMSMS